MTDWKKKCEEVPAEVLDELKKKHLKELESLAKKLQDAENGRERSERSKKKLQQEVYNQSCV